MTPARVWAAFRRSRAHVVAALDALDQADTAALSFEAANRTQQMKNDVRVILSRALLALTRLLDEDH